MKIDTRLTQLAENLLKNSVNLKKGQHIYLECKGTDTLDLMRECIRIATKMGAHPFYYFNDTSFLKSFLQNATEEQIKQAGQLHLDIMKKMDAYIGIRGDDNIFDLSDVPAAKLKAYSLHYVGPVHLEQRCDHTNWCILRYPNNTMAALSKMSTSTFEDFYFKACLLDYKKMEKAMTPLVKLMEKTDKVYIKAPETDLHFSIKNIPVFKCCGQCNIPDGEVYTAPVKDSINGTVRFNTQTIEGGTLFNNIALTFKDGKIVKATSDVNNAQLQKVLDTDAGSRFMGEFAFGLNPEITSPILDILFDEKISGSFHMAIGDSCGDTNNGNKSSIHWDLVQIQTKAWGGGEIYFDGKLIRKDGLFVLPELKGLNPDALK